MSLIRLNIDYVKTWFDLNDAERKQVYNDLTAEETWKIGTICYEGDLKYLREYYNQNSKPGFGGIKALPSLVKVKANENTWLPCWMELAIHPKQKLLQYTEPGDYAILRCPLVEIDTYPSGFSLLKLIDGALDPQFEAFVLSSAEKIEVKVREANGL